MYQSKIKALRSADMSEKILQFKILKNEIIERIIHNGEKAIDVASKFGIRADLIRKYV